MSLTNRTGRLATPLTGRSQDEEGRTATPLELFFDLVFVVAVAQVSNELTLALPRETSVGPCSSTYRVRCHLVGVDGLHLVRIGIRHR